MKQAQAERLRIVTAGLVCAGAAAAAAVWLSLLADRLERTVDRISTEMINLELNIGYGGFIHAYKNYILRPGEEIYWTEAVAHYDAAQVSFDNMDAAIDETELQVNLKDLRETLARYRLMLDRAREAREGGASVREIDELVQISDADAVVSMKALQDTLRALLSDRLRTARIWRFLNFLAILAVFGLIALVAIYYRRKDAEIERKAMAEITRARDQLSAVFSAVRSGVIGLGRDREVVTLNPPARHLLGGMSRQTPFDWPERIRFLDGEELAPLVASNDPVDRALSGTDIRDEVHLMTRGGTADEARYVRMSSARIIDPASQVAAVIVLDDITEQERNRQQVERNQRLDALGQLTGGIAHDFNNVLATILYANELASKSTGNDETRQLLQRARTSVERGRQLTTRLLAFAKRQPGLASRLRVGELFRDMHDLMRPLIEERIELHVDPGPPGLQVFCDVGQLENALLNLVLNARDAILGTEKGGIIRLAARTADTGRASELPGEVVISVSDDGPGMSHAVRDRATDPFFTTRSESGGSGLGLSMVYGFVQQANGDLRITSEEGGGTTVELLLPMPDPEDEALVVEADAPVEVGNGEIVLVVEDEPELLEMTATVLRDLGYRTVNQPSGTAAWDWVDQGGEFDVLLTDVVMPGGLGGFDLVRKMRDKAPGKPALLMSGYTGFTAAERRGTGTVLLQKPCSPQNLARALRTALRDAPDPTDTHLAL